LAIVSVSLAIRPVKECHLMLSILLGSEIEASLFPDSLDQQRLSLCIKTCLIIKVSYLDFLVEF
jgi:hypothetical protein